MRISLRNHLIQEVLMNSLQSPYYLGVSKSYDERFIAVSEQYLGQISILDTTKDSHNHIILQIQRNCIFVSIPRYQKKLPAPPTHPPTQIMH